MAGAARHGKRMFHFFIMYGVSTELVVVVTLATKHPQWPLYWGLQEWTGERLDRTDWLRWAGLVVQGFAVLCCLTSFYTVLPLALDMYLACAELHRSLGRRLKAEYCCPDEAALMSTVLQASILSDQALADLLPHLLVVSVIMPIISTVEVLANGVHTDWFAIGTAPLILTIFVPLCLAGEQLAQARRGVAARAAKGPWLDEPPRQRRLRLNLMLAAQGRGAQVRGKGIGTLDRAACGSALRSWFSFMQMVLNLRSKSG